MLILKVPLLRDPSARFTRIGGATHTMLTQHFSHRVALLALPITLALALTTPALSHATPPLTTVRTSQHTKKPLVNITLTLPQLAGRGARNFNAAVKLATAKEIASFKNDVREYSQDPPEPPYDKGANVLAIMHQVKFSNARYLSVVMNKYINFPGAAHPSSGTYMVTYDLKAQKALGLADLFHPGTPYLSTLSRYCKSDLEQQGTEPDLLGLKPTAPNFAHWNLTKRGLLITFDPYQVAPYAAGPQSVTIPYAKLRSLMKPAVLAGVR